MFTHLVFWPWLLGVVFLALGLLLQRRDLASAREKWIALGPIFVAAPLATFAGEHFVSASAMTPMVPSFLPAPLAVVYFVGIALLAAAVSLTSMKFVRLAATLLGVMFLLFVLTLYLPGALDDPRDRMGWNFVLRESTFAGGAWALAGSLQPTHRWMMRFGRFVLAAAVLYFSFEQLLHPELTPGVPDAIATPDSVPLHLLLGYPAGAFLLFAGVGLLINSTARAAAVAIGILMTGLTVVLYLPLLAFTADPALMTQAINFVADTLLFGGTALLVARGLPGAEATT